MRRTIPKTSTRALTADILRRLFDYDAEHGRLLDPFGNIVGGTGHNKGRRRYITVGGRIYLSYRLIWLHQKGEWPVGVIDHIDGNSLNDRIENLRDVSHQWNCQNLHRAPSHNKSCGLLGVTFYWRTGRWIAQIKVDGKRQHIGYYATPEEAHAAYVARKREVHAGNTM